MSRNISNIQILNKETLEQYTKDSTSWKQLLEKCGYKTFKNNLTVKQKLITYEIDFTHLLTRNLSNLKNISEETLIDFVKKSNNIKDLMILCGYNNYGNSKYIKDKLIAYNISTSHFEDYNSMIPIKRFSIEEIFCKDSTYKGCGSGLKRHLIKHFDWELKCQNQKCPIKHIEEFEDPDSTNKIPLLIELDHIDGNNKNNEITNLRFLCILCHSLTSTYRTKNKIYEEKEETKCIDCNTIISKDSLRCDKCAHLLQRKVVERPSLEQINNDLEELKTMIAVGKKYNVSDNTIRKWIRGYKKEESKEEN
jgi:hypothetical protein